MYIGIISDTHDNLNLIKKAVEVFNTEKIGLLLHAGDFVSPFTASVFKKLNCPMFGVFGNNDGDKLLLKDQFKNIAELYVGIMEKEINGRKIAMMHEPKFLKSLDKAREYNLVVYGHTHQKNIKKDNNFLMINPGECSGYLTNKASIAFCDLKTMDAEIRDI
ncbi:metallophosphoesterase [bacterium]